MKISVERQAGRMAGTVRLSGVITTSEGVGTVWYDFPAAMEPFLSESGAPWLLTMLPFAAATGESIELSLPLDPFFLENVRGLLGTWNSWYPDLKRIDIQAPLVRASPTAGREAQFFSGGVDSWFTLLRHVDSTPRFPQVGNVDDLITVWGFDMGRVFADGGAQITIDRDDEFRQLADSTREVAARYGKHHIAVSTNLREAMSGTWRVVWGPRWRELSHGTALAAVGLLLEKRYSKLRIGSTHHFWEPFGYGSHPMTDTLFSTSATAFAHDHALYSRIDKIERIAESDYALSKLKVCYVEGGFRNCSVCVKCHRMLLCFDILGILPKATTFNATAFHRNRDRHILVSTDNDIVRLTEVRDLAQQHGRGDIVALMNRSLSRSELVRRVTKPLAKVSWRARSAAFRRLAGDMIGASLS
jgi:hypothetical protein